MEDIIEVLQIFLKYGNPVMEPDREHGGLIITIDDQSKVSLEDKKALRSLGYIQKSDGSFHSYRYGSA